MIEERQAITDNIAGTTRDRHYGKAEWNGIIFGNVESGGYIDGSDDVFEAEIRKQVTLAIEESDSILFLVDVHHGLTAMDETIAQMLRRAKKPVLLAANKVDELNARQYDSAEFYGLGLGEVFNISAQSGAGSGELLDALVQTFTEAYGRRGCRYPEVRHRG